MPNNDVKKSFGASVKYWRHRLGISQEALAERSDMHRTYICDVERGSRNVSLETIERLARALEISTFTLFYNFRRIPAGARAAEPIPEELGDILLVEDDANDEALALRALREANMANHIEVVRDGAAALDFLFGAGPHSARRPQIMPQLILLDLNLPKVDGLEVLRKIKTDSRTRAIPVAVMTASRRSQDVAESLKLGAEAYIVKPVDFQNFSEVVPKLNLHWAVLKSVARMSA